MSLVRVHKNFIGWKLLTKNKKGSTKHYMVYGPYRISILKVDNCAKDEERNLFTYFRIEQALLQDNRERAERLSKRVVDSKLKVKRLADFVGGMPCVGGKRRTIGLA